MRERRDTEHLLRLAGLFAAGIAVFLVASAFMVPDDFGVYGHYRAGALTDIKVLPVAHADGAACAECHADVVEKRGANAARRRFVPGLSRAGRAACPMGAAEG